MHTSRRRVLQLAPGIFLGTSIAGCIGDDSEESEGFAAFFTLRDWADAVADGVMEFEDPVPVGRIGHGWEPDFEVTTRIAAAPVFVYLDTPEFQWARTAAATLERDYPEVTTIDALDGVPLLSVDREHDHEYDHDHDHDDHDTHDVHVGSIEIIDRSTDEVIADLHDDHWHGALPTVPVGDHISLGARVVDEDGEEISLGDDGDYSLSARVDDHANEIIHTHSHGDHVHLEGHASGTTAVVFQLIHDGDVAWEAPAIDATVEGDDETSDDAEVVVTDLVIIDRSTDTAVADLHGDHWHGGLPAIEHGEHVSLGAQFFDDTGELIPLEGDGGFRVDARVADGEAHYVDFESHGDHLHVTGIDLGETAIVFQLVEDDAVVWEAPSIAASVVEEADDIPAELVDPHAWVDPVRARQMIDNIAMGLAEADPDNAETFFDNADSYIEQLDAVHDRFEAELADREHDIVVLAGHDSFQYLADRYGFEIHTPVGVSPDASPSAAAISETIDLINEHDIDVILTDAFEADDLAETIVANSEATAIRSVSPAEGTTNDWLEAGWGYIEQMEEINLPAFKAALGVDD